MMWQVDIHLNYPFLYKWKTRQGISVISNTDAESYFNLFQSINNEERANKIFENIDGNFAAIIHNDEFVLAAVDRVRCFPLFYKITADKITVTDNIQEVEEKYYLNEAAAAIFKKIYCTEGSTTLLQHWQQVQPGEFILIKKLTGEVSKKRYFVFRNKLPEIHINSLELRKLILDVFKKILDSIGNKTIIVPLTAGYDSRLIISALHELKAKNIFTYTYGRADSFEKPIAEKIAQRLGLDWRFIEYTNELLDSFFSEKFHSYFSKNHFFTSLPCEQDFFALQYLSENNLLPGNGVILSGYLGGAYAGNRASYDFISRDDDDQQEYNFSNRGSKFIVNSIRVYEHFGLEWSIPLIASPLLDYSLHVPVKERSIENGYHNFLSEVFFRPLDIDFIKEDHYYKKNKFKILLKKILPQKVVRFIQNRKQISNIVDPNNTVYLKKKLEVVFYNRGHQIKDSIDFNDMYIKKYLQYLDEKFLDK